MALGVWRANSKVAQAGIPPQSGAGKGSYEVWWLPRTERRATIPHHASREIAPGTLRAILKDLGLTEDDLRSV
ncbi:MAG TPA: type II toxin-antitoxin system HicA family toxin [Dehalococcoidia bacterium]|nr:type II toxin-antitoxin system HicA family toxin [Dehalococcoidia bacterium]